LDLAQAVDLVERVKLVLHTLDCDVLAGLYALGLQDLAEGALALFGHQPVLWAGMGF
jgi:hypothetical protein